MNKTFFYLGMILTASFILFSGVDLFAFQTDPTEVENWKDLANKIIGPYFASVTAFSGAVTALAGLLFSYVFKDLNGNWKRLITLAIALILSIAANLLNFGVFASMTVAGTVMVAIQVTFGANGLWEWIKDSFKRKK